MARAKVLSFCYSTTSLNELCHEIYQNSNSRSCKHIEYKIIAQNNKEGINNKAQKRVGKDGQT